MQERAQEWRRRQTTKARRQSPEVRNQCTFVARSLLVLFIITAFVIEITSQTSKKISIETAMTKGVANKKNSSVPGIGKSIDLIFTGVSVISMSCVLLTKAVLPLPLLS